MVIQRNIKEVCINWGGVILCKGLSGVLDRKIEVAKMKEYQISIHFGGG